MERRERLRAVSFPALIVIFPVYGVTDIVTFILDSPVFARVLVHLCRAHFVRRPAGYLDGNILTYFIAGQAAYLAADARHLGDMREF
jgi:hypothetical protein